MIFNILFYFPIVVWCIMFHKKIIAYSFLWTAPYLCFISCQYVDDASILNCVYFTSFMYPLSCVFCYVIFSFFAWKKNNNTNSSILYLYLHFCLVVTAYGRVLCDIKLFFLKFVLWQKWHDNCVCSVTKYSTAKSILSCKGHPSRPSCIKWRWRWYLYRAKSS